MICAITENDSRARSLRSGSPCWCNGDVYMVGTEKKESRNRGENHPIVLSSAAQLVIDHKAFRSGEKTIAISRLPPEERATFLTPDGYNGNPFPAEIRFAGVMHDPHHPSQLIPVGQVPRPHREYDPRAGNGMIYPGSIGWRGAWARATGRRVY